MKKSKNTWKILIYSLLIILAICSILAGCAPDSPSNGGEDGAGGAGGGDVGVIDLSRQETELRCLSSSLSYTGQAITPNINVYFESEFVTRVYHDQEHDDLTISYEDNVNAGIATATVTAKDSSTRFTGSASKTFEITKGYANANSLESLIEKASNSNYKKVTVYNNFTIEKGQTLTIAEGVTLDLDGKGLINKGTIINNGEIVYTLFCTIDNQGSLVNNGTVTFSRNLCNIYNSGSIVNNGMLDFGKNYNGYAIYTNTAIGGTSPITAENNRVRFRHDLADCQITFEQDSLTYNKQAQEAKITAVSKDGNKIATSGFSKTYADNVNAGMASVTLTADHFSQHYYGSTTAYYTIQQVDNINVKKVEDFVGALGNLNYKQITILDTTDSKLFSYRYDMTIPAGQTVIINEPYMHVSGTMTVNGKLIVNCYRSDASFGWYYSSQYRAPMDLVVNGEVVLAEGREFLIDSLSGSGVLTNYGGVLLHGDVAGVRIDNYGEVYGGVVRGVDGAFAIVNKTSGMATGTTYIDQKTVDEFGTFVSGGTCIVRRQATADIVRTTGDLPLDGYTTAYQLDTVQKAIVNVYDHDNTGYIDNTDSTYTIAYNHVSDADQPKNAGAVSVEVAFNYLSKYYYGAVQVSYEITKTSIVIDSSSMTLAAAMKSGNYDDYTLTIDSVAEGTIAEGAVLTIATGVTLQSKSLTGSGSIVNNGTLINNNMSMMTEGSTEIDGMLQSFSGVFTNNGVVYVNGEQSAVKGGIVYTRTHLDNASEPSDIGGQQFVFDAMYDASDNLTTVFKPEVTLIADSLLAEDIDYTIAYANNNTASPRQGSWASQAAVKVFSTITSQYVYGNRAIPFYIERGTAEVANINQLIAVLSLNKPASADYGYNYVKPASDSPDNAEYSCFTTVKLTASIWDLRSTGNIDLTVLRTTTLDLNGYEMGFDRVSIYAGYTLINKGTIRASDDWAADPIREDGLRIGISRADYQGHPIAGTEQGYIIGTVTTADGLEVLSRYCDVINLGASIATCRIGNSSNSLQLNLNGYTIGEGASDRVTVSMNANITIDNPATKFEINVLYLEGYATGSMLTLKNIDIGYLNYGSGNTSDILNNYVSMVGGMIYSYKT